jgi:tetraacyldisaccharide-1-P 4'-kinase
MAQQASKQASKQNHGSVLTTVKDFVALNFLKSNSHNPLVHRISGFFIV